MSTLAVNQPRSLTESARHLCRVLAGYSPSELRQRLGLPSPSKEDPSDAPSTPPEMAPEPGAHASDRPRSSAA